MMIWKKRLYTLAVVNALTCAMNGWTLLHDARHPWLTSFFCGLGLGTMLICLLATWVMS